MTSPCDNDKNELLYDSPECSKYSDLDQITELLRDKLKMSSTQDKSKDLNFSTRELVHLKDLQ